MKPIHKVTGLLLAGTLTFSTFALTAFAADEIPASSLKVTAASNFAPSVTQTFDASANQITTTWWMQDAEEVMINVQGILTYDSTKLKVDMTDGVNRTYDVDNDEYEEHILCVTGSSDTVVNYQPKTIPEGYNAGIRFNATNPDGYSLGNAEKKVPFFSVTFTPVDGAQGDTTVYLDVNYMAVRSEGDKTYHPLIRHSEITDTEANYLPAEPAAVYAGPYDPDYTDVEPTTAEPTTAEPTTAEPTTEEPTTEEPTTAEPTTEEPTTAEPTTEEPTTEEPTTEEPTTVEPTTEEPTTEEPTTAEPTTAEPTTAEPTTAEPTTAEPTTESTALIVDAKALADEAATNEMFDFSVEGIPFTVNKGETLTIVYKLDTTDANGKVRGIRSVSWSAGYDASFLTLKKTSVPFTDLYTLNDNTPGEIIFNASTGNDPFDVQPNDEFIVLEFEAAKAGETEVSVTLTALMLAEATVEPTTAEPTTAEPTTAEPTTVAPTTTEPTTVEPTTVEPTTVEPTTEPAPTFLLGDVNNDGKIDITDATLVQMIAAEILVPSGTQKLAGDVNKDGKIDITDATLIQMFAAEVIFHF